MSDKSKIEWTDASWNPTRGCSHKSHGCDGCYAEKVAARFSGKGLAYEGLINPKTGKWNGVMRMVYEKLDQPLRWKKPRRIFVDSMSDLFHDNVPEHYINSVFNIMALAPRHTFQILTKRPERMQRYASDLASKLCWDKGPFPNVWLGVSVEDQPTADARTKWLLKTPAAVRFISYEPALDAIDFQLRMNDGPEPAINWLICGGESGAGARPMHPDWARSARDQCRAAGVPFFFKQWGEWGDVGIDNAPKRMHNNEKFRHEFRKPFPHDFPTVWRVGKKKTGRLLDGREWNEMPKEKA